MQKERKKEIGLNILSVGSWRNYKKKDLIETGVFLCIAGIVRESIVDGPGLRLTVFAQGCPHNCIGCHNSQTHSFDGGKSCDIGKILSEIDGNPLLDGVTFSGGEPVCQSKGFCFLAKEIKKRGLNIVLYSGYTLEELTEKAKSDGDLDELLRTIDYLVDGRFVLEQKDLTLPFRGSKNQRFIDMVATREKQIIVLAK